MAEKCICCGKKVGLLNGSHLNNQVCDNCYFPIGSYLTAIEDSNDINIMDSNYNQLISKIQLLQYFSLGKEYILNYAQSIINKHKDELIKQNEYATLIKNLKLSTSNTIEGYIIKKYCKVVSKSTFLGIGTFDCGDIGQSIWHGTESDTFSEKLEIARNSSINKMVDEAIKQGGNAIIGVSFDYINFGTNMIGVVANGTVVEIVKQNEQVNDD